MKVSTDACVQAAWTPIRENVKHVLDIGAGTGLLSLMLAQRNQKIVIDAIEMDEPAAKQAKENVANSGWNDRINIICADAKTYAYDKQYDLIISNPPFFQNSLLGPNEERNKARHTQSLGYQELLNIFEKNLAANGYASVLLPYIEQKIWEGLLMGNNWGMVQRLLVLPKIGATANRVVSLCAKMPLQQLPDETIAIRRDAANYTNEFIDLLRPFYLHL